MELFGEYRHTIDNKNRLFVPAKHREILGETFFVTRKIMDPCLGIYSEEEWHKFSEKINSLPDSQAGAIKQYIYSKTVQVTADAHGRIVLPANLLPHIGITEKERNVVIIGSGDHAQIWNEATWDQKEENEFSLQNLQEQYSSLHL